MAEIAKKPIKITETILRDAHQSLIATRMTTEQMMPIVDKMDKVGYHAVECWGGATFDASLRFLHEDPWERLRKFRDGFKNTKLQMLFRGQNILGYRPYADDVVEYFVQKSAANGIDIIRIFDCMNDMRNLQTAVTAANKEKAHAQVAMSYTLGDAYTLEYWVELAKRIEDMGANSICVKDMAGLLCPYQATELVTALKEAVEIPIEMHTHYTSGVASMTYLKSVEAGADIIDTAMSPFALGTSQPATEVMVETFKGTPYDTGLDQNLLAEIAVNTNSSSEIFEQLIRINEEDVIIGISFPRYSMRTLKALEFASNRKAKVITLTDSVHSPMNLYSSCNLIARSDMASIVDSLVAPLSVINALVVALCMKKQKEVVNTLETLEQIWGEYQVYSKDELNQVDDTLTESSSGKSEENKDE